VTTQVTAVLVFDDDEVPHALVDPNASADDGQTVVVATTGRPGDNNVIILDAGVDPEEALEGVPARKIVYQLLEE
jgi:hypothetical protein